ncbi:MAG: hypothetical protein R2685_10760 [Candidatus Nitrosocosmicus sp.]|nr:hypothetical protein [Candidatus Nitrosocosmicus sp.]
MLDIDLTNIETYQDAFDQCDSRLADAITYLKKTIIPFLGNFTEVDKDIQVDRINEISIFATQLIHLILTVHSLEINRGNNKRYLDEEAQESVVCDK